MALTSRDRRALALFIPTILAMLAYAFWPESSETAAVVSSIDSIPSAEQRLARLRQMSALVPGREAVLTKVKGELGQREKGLIQADTVAQAQAQLLQILRRVGGKQSPPVDIRGQELGQARVLSDDYGEVLITVTLDCRIEQLLNLLADLSAQPEILATSELRLGQANPKEKNLPVRLTMAGIVPRQLIPEKKGAGAF